MLEEVRSACLALPGIEERFPFGPDVLVYSLEGRMVALIGIDRIPPWLNLKCNPERSLELREQYAAIAPAYHMNKRHWNTILLDGSVPLSLIRELIVHSYQLVLAKLPRRLRAQYAAAIEALRRTGGV